MPALSSLLATWADYYGNHQVASVAIRTLHLSGLMVGGGTAVSTDWRLLSAWATPGSRGAALAQLAASHRAVVASLAVVATTGAAMLAADTDIYLHSTLFWVKMALFATLLLNGLLLLAAERRVASPASAAWRPLAIVSSVSLTLWFVLLLVGTWLTVGA